MTTPIKSAADALEAAAKDSDRAAAMYEPMINAEWADDNLRSMLRACAETSTLTAARIRALGQRIEPPDQIAEVAAALEEVITAVVSFERNWDQPWRAQLIDAIRALITPTGATALSRLISDADARGYDRAANDHAPTVQEAAQILYARWRDEDDTTLVPGFYAATAAFEGSGGVKLAERVQMTCLAFLRSIATQEPAS